MLCTGHETNGVGMCTREQYVLAMLIKMCKINQDDIDSLERQFNRLDTDTDGVLTRDDLSKLERADYDTGLGVQNLIPSSSNSSSAAAVAP